MAASVENRQFVCIETDLATTARGLQSHISQRSNSSVMAFDFRPPSTTLEISIPNGVVPMDDPYEGFSSDDEHEREKQWKKALIHINSEVEPSICDPRDQGTSDHWIKRNPSLIRLTGKHPFNCEPPLNRLMHHGFLTPSSLHYVRNHGHVPKATWEEWKIEICGLIKRPATFTMNELVNNFQSHEFPVTLVCAGNRRKEQNMVKQSIGFNWGPAGISTSVWRGVLLRDVLQKVGISSRRHGALNVCFEGAEDLPGGGGSKYGTSIKREIAMDPSRDIIIAFMQNGELLSPDHGFPVRMIIPGFIGGRMVKWLKRIIVTTEESQSYYHFNDNRVLPSHVDAQLANEEGWWYQPEYIINELNINSVITTPGHEEILPINSSTTQRSYTFRGYAYSGGGRKVTRVELTLDGGDSWILCNLEHPEKPNRYGKYWCWCFWSLQIEVLDLLSAKEIAVRAWDEALNTQPQKLIWNLMGMMNNCWFKVKTNMCRPHKGEIGIVFEHPTQPANNPGGWMAKQKHIDALDGLKKSISTPFINISSNKYSMSEVKKHSTASSAWIVVNGHVYDCTKFIKDHPGGADSILINAGTDCSEEFDAIHSNKAKTMLEDYRIGEVLTFPDYSSDTSTSSSPSNSIHGGNNLATIIESSKHSGTLGTGQKIPCKLISKTVISHDVRLFRFALPSKDETLGLPVGKHIFLCATIDGKLCIRAYTPTSSVDEVGYFDLLIKIYFRDTNPKFPNGGNMSQYLESLPMGATVDIKGPLGHIMYNGKGNFTVHGEHKHAKRLAMIAGGTGITPIYQIMQAILKDPEDDTEMFLVYANRTEDDILLRNELDEWGKKHKNVNIWYVVGEVLREKWKYNVGFITESILRDHVPRGSNDSLALICGPPPMIQFAVLPNLEKMNYDIKKSCLQF